MVIVHLKKKFNSGFQKKMFIREMEPFLQILKKMKNEVQTINVEKSTIAM